VKQNLVVLFWAYKLQEDEAELTGFSLALYEAASMKR
jgi:hypothetical protein